MGLTTTILSVLTTSMTISNASANINVQTYDSNDENVINNEDRPVLEVIEHVVNESVNQSALLTEDEIIDNAIDDVQEQVFNNSIDEEEINNLKTEVKSQAAMVNTADYIIGNGPINKLITMGQNEDDDNTIYFLMNFLVSQYYPELRNLSPEYKYQNLPNPSSPLYQTKLNQMISAFNTRPISISDMASYLNSSINNNVNNAATINNFPNSTYYYENYDFAYLEDLLDELNQAVIINLVAAGVTLLGALILMCIPGGQGAGTVLAIASSALSLSTIAPFLAQKKFNINDYELAVINHYPKIYLHPITFIDIKTKSENKALEYYGRFYTKDEEGSEYNNIEGFIPTGGSDGNTHTNNNTLDAYRHTYWNALMYSTIGAEEAKAFTDAHEYGEIVNGFGDSRSRKLSADMDLLNNEAGRVVGNWWIRNGEWFRSLRYVHTEIPSDVWDALAYYTFHVVSYGYYSGYNIYTFGDIDNNGKYDVETEDYRIDDYSSIIINRNGTEGLVNTNFGEAKKYMFENNVPIYPRREYFFYPPFC